jgi:hypothetical protein
VSGDVLYATTIKPTKAHLKVAAFCFKLGESISLLASFYLNQNRVASFLLLFFF